MNTGLEYTLALRMRSATRWVEGQQGLLPPDEEFVPPIGYGGVSTKKVDPAITVSLVPLGLRTVYVVDPTTGNVRTDLPKKFVLWTDAGSAANYYPGSSWKLYFPEGLFAMGDGGGLSYPQFINSYNATAFDGTTGGTAASWAGELPERLWKTATYQRSLNIRNAPQVALATNLPYFPFGIPYTNARWVLPEIIQGKTYLKDVNIIVAKDTRLALQDIGIWGSYVYGSTNDGTKVTGGAIPSSFCMISDYGVKVIFRTNGLVNTYDNVLIAAVDNVFQIIQVIHNKAPNYVAPSGALGAPLGSPLGG